MRSAERYNDVNKKAPQFCVQGTFLPDGYAKGQMDTRWQTLDELTGACTREDFQKLTRAHFKELGMSFKRDAKRFKTAA